MKEFFAIRTRDGQSVLLTRGEWRIRIPVTDLPRWQAFYQRLRDRGAPKTGGPGPYHRFYEQPCQALEYLADKIRGETT